jgi:hypothetical protein
MTTVGGDRSFQSTAADEESTAADEEGRAWRFLIESSRASLGTLAALASSPKNRCA